MNETLLFIVTAGTKPHISFISIGIIYFKHKNNRKCNGKQSPMAGPPKNVHRNVGAIA